MKNKISSYKICIYMFYKKYISLTISSSVVDYISERKNNTRLHNSKKK